MKSDPYVLETNVHFPTDLNRLWDACRKCLDLLPRLARSHDLPGWRKAATWQAQLKTFLRICGSIQHGGGAKKPERLKKAVTAYLQKAYALEQKVWTRLLELRRTQTLSLVEQRTLGELEYDHDKLIQHLDLIERRVLKGEPIPHAEKDLSLFEPHTEWSNKGKVSPAVELGHKVLITPDQDSLILDYKVMDQRREVKETLPLVDRLLTQYGESLQSWSVDKGFSAQQDRELVELFIPEVIMPKKGRRAQAEQAREAQ